MISRKHSAFEHGLQSFIGMLFSVFTCDLGFLAGMGARGSRAIRLAPVPYISVPLIGVLLCFLQWYLLRPTEYPSPPTPRLPAIPLVSLSNGNCTGLAQGWAQWQSWRQLERTECHQILKGTNSQSTFRKRGSFASKMYHYFFQYHQFRP